MTLANKLLDLLGEGIMRDILQDIDGVRQYIIEAGATEITYKTTVINSYPGFVIMATVQPDFDLEKARLSINTKYDNLSDLEFSIDGGILTISAHKEL